MDSLIRDTRKAVLQHRLAGRGQRIVVAVSGGRDSVLLLHALHLLAPEFGWKLAVAHFNHRLRGRASAADARFVQAMARRLKLRCFLGAGDVRARAKREGQSLEMMARQLRHAFLARTARRFRARCVAIGHHADDQVELFFVRLFRGAGGMGLGGMGWSGPSPSDSRIFLIRPLLGFARTRLEACAQKAGLRFREDASNTDTDILRNRIRRELVPFLERRFTPALKEVVVRTMEVLRADGDLVLAEATTFLAGKGSKSFRSLHRSIQRLVISLQVRTLGVEPDFRLIEAVRLSPETPVMIGPKTTVTRWRDGKVDVSRERRLDYRRATRGVSLASLPHRCVFAGCEIVWRFRLRPQKFPNPNGVEQFDAAKVGGEIELRFWRPGDRFQPLGFSKASKLQDLFVNRKVPAELRRQSLLATAASGEIFWVEGLPPGENFKLTAATRRVLAWSFRRDDGDGGGPRPSVRSSAGS